MSPVRAPFPPEVSYSEYGERGSVDLLAWHAATRTLLVIEVKSQLGAIELTIRKLDEKARPAPVVAVRRFGWHAVRTARVLVLPEEMTVRRLVERHETTFHRAFPTRGRNVRRWLRSPDGVIGGLWFLSLSDGTRHRWSRNTRTRVRVARPPAA